MSKSRNFTLFLLKKGFNARNSLKEEHTLGAPVVDASTLPNDATLFVADIKPQQPWWKLYWGIKQDIWQVVKGALVFLPVKDRFFAITFGHTYHNLKETCYEYDFGLRTTLNALDPKKIKSTDILQPENARRERIQSPTAADLTYFDFNRDESIVKKLTGAVKEHYKNLLTNITGACSLTVSSKAPANGIVHLCEQLLEIYEKEDFKINFPDIQNIVPVKDPETLLLLNANLITAFNDKVFELVLAIPEIVNRDESFQIKYTGAGKDSTSYDDVYIDHYREYLIKRNVINTTIESLKQHKLNIQDENETIRNSYSIFKCLLFDTDLHSNHFHLCDGEWYQINTDFLMKLKSGLDPIFTDYGMLTDCTEKREDSYINSIASTNNDIVCLDKTNIAPTGQTQVEPCDLYLAKDGYAHLIHLKISTRSTSLSHLFNQGVNAVYLLRQNGVSQRKLKELLPRLAHHTPIDIGNYVIIFGIITAKNKSKKSDTLPIFSRISLLRCVNTLRSMNISTSIVLINDLVDRKKKNDE